MHHFTRFPIFVNKFHALSEKCSSMWADDVKFCNEHANLRVHGDETEEKKHGSCKSLPICRSRRSKRKGMLHADSRASRPDAAYGRADALS